MDEIILGPLWAIILFFVAAVFLWAKNERYQHGRTVRRWQEVHGVDDDELDEILEMQEDDMAVELLEWREEGDAWRG